jgi:hypothetical protein
MEQVQRTCEALRADGFSHIYTLECIERPLEIKVNKVAYYTVGVAAAPLPAPRPGGEAAEAASAGIATLDEESAAAADRKRKRVDPTAPANKPRTCVPPACFEHFHSRGALVIPSVEVPEITAHPSNSMRGHTGYLTFATWINNDPQ